MGDVDAPEHHLPGLDARQSADAPQEGALAASFHAGQSDDLAGAHLQGEVVEADETLFDADRVQGQDRLTQGGFGPVGDLDGFAEHELDQLGRRDRHVALADDLAAAHDRDLLAELLDLFELVGDEDDAHAICGQLAQRVEQQAPLVGRDPRGRLVEDEHPCPKPEQAGDLDLLALADRQRPRRRLEVELEPEPVAQRGELIPNAVPAQPKRTRAAEQQVVEDRHGQKDEGVLVQHADAGRRRGVR